MYRPWQRNFLFFICQPGIPQSDAFRPAQSTRGCYWIKRTFGLLLKQGYVLSNYQEVSFGRTAVLEKKNPRYFVSFSLWQESGGTSYFKAIIFQNNTFPSRNCRVRESRLKIVDWTLLRMPTVRTMYLSRDWRSHCGKWLVGTNRVSRLNSNWFLFFLRLIKPASMPTSRQRTTKHAFHTCRSLMKTSNKGSLTWGSFRSGTCQCRDSCYGTQSRHSVTLVPIGTCWCWSSNIILANCERICSEKNITLVLTLKIIFFTSI